ncbi:CPBP family intramembrane glutamic endopeptidase [Aestuariispira insulae]|uniref:CAAX prenyl protease-like protein n=1 Tax=Aestuariispira insulae TaxID=1461337 RepID=A0A3D9HF88_9PROT|nr:type II CAAX endopeptidase family protein [Aestuariispira insulae]RED48148.1 CAAX prenyl protease-like protein [Aestuariispira insulae]
MTENPTQTENTISGEMDRSSPLATATQSTYLFFLREKRVRWFMVLLSMACAALVYFLLSIVLGAVLVGFFNDSTVLSGNGGWRSMPLADAKAYYILLMLSIIILIPASYLAVRLFQKRGFRSLITVRSRINWRTLAISGLALLLPGLTIFLITTLFTPDDASISFDPVVFWPFFALSIMLIPLQIFAEEIFFRGYLMQSIAAFTRIRLIILAVPALFFALLHFYNPAEAYNDIWAKLSYITVALYIGWLVLKTDSLEASIGLHLAQNILAIVVVSSPFAPALTPTLLEVHDIDTKIEFLSTLALFGLHALILFKGTAIWRRFSPKR